MKMSPLGKINSSALVESGVGALIVTGGERRQISITAELEIVEYAKMNTLSGVSERLVADRFFFFFFF